MLSKHCLLACRLKEKGRTFRESFLAKLCLLLRGTVAAPPERFGETLADEHIRGGEHIHSPMHRSLPCPGDCPLPILTFWAGPAALQLLQESITCFVGMFVYGSWQHMHQASVQLCIASLLMHRDLPQATLMLSLLQS